MKRVGIAQIIIFVVATSLVLLSCCHSFLHVSLSTQASTEHTLYVGEDEEFSSIQAAINAARNDTAHRYRIIVYNGIYYENLTISDDLSEGLDLFGEDRNTTTIDGLGRNHVIMVNASKVKISHFTIQNGASTEGSSIIHISEDNAIITDNLISQGHHGIYINNINQIFTDDTIFLIYDNIIRNNNGDGIYLNQSSDINITYNTIKNNNNGIYATGSENINISKNVAIYNNEKNGIYLNNSCRNNIISQNNNISYNTKSGIYLNDWSNSTDISYNQISGNQISGVVLENCSYNEDISNNSVMRNGRYGFKIVGINNVITYNTVSHNEKDGLFLTADYQTILRNNTIYNNTLSGIKLYNTTNDCIYGNEIFSNLGYGMYLDFFTKNTFIYNNSFFDNGVNAIDKSYQSFSHNRWNRDKKRGTNIIGGSNISGNYWDDFDEASEGAVDTDNDSIADDNYTIYYENIDYGPLVDTTPPTVSDLGVAPSIQFLGGYTNISVTVTDNTEVRNVYLVVTNQDGNTTNSSIIQNRSGTTYFCNKQFSPVGNFSFSIAASDPRNWIISETINFSIDEGIPPTITDNSPSTASPSASFTFNATVVDDSDSWSQLRDVRVIWSHGNTTQNETMNHTTGDSFEHTVLLNSNTNLLQYRFYASDQWGTHTTSSMQSISVVDNTPPLINVRRYGESFDTLPNSYTFIAKITDDSVVDTVSIDFWYSDSTNRTVEMDRAPSLGSDYYKKIIIPEKPVDRVYCVIHANDTSDNSNNTKPPTPILDAPDSGFVLQNISFSAANSFDLDGSITNYSWSFGDGTRESGINATHQYHTSGTYTIHVTVQDDNQNTATNSTTITITEIKPNVISWGQLYLINYTYNLTLTKQFYCYDSDFDGRYDSFIDPNQKLTLAENAPVQLDTHDCFLISTNNDAIPEFFWDTQTGEIISIAHTKGIISSEEIDEQKEQSTATIVVEKKIWIYFEITDLYTDSPVSITTGSRQIASDLIWRKNGQIYVLDDAETQYVAVFTDIFPAVEPPIFQPSDGGIIGEDQPTITIMYNVPVTITYATFGTMDVTDDFVTSDNEIFTYTPPSYLSNGTYPLVIDAQAQKGTSFQSASASYIYFKYGQPPQQSFFEANWQILLIGGMLSAIAAMFLYFRIAHVTIDDFVYIKHTKLVPFLKTFIVGPMSVHVDNKQISKAEFYIDGNLKETVTEYPFLWKWQEPAFLKHILETKVYDDEGNSVSSGEKPFYIFNPFGERLEVQS